MPRILRNLTLLAMLGGLSLAASAARAAEWGSIKGRFVYDGTPPVPAKLDINKDQATCGGHNLVDQSLEVGPTGSIANVVVWLREKKVAVNPEYKKSDADKVTLDNLNCHFIPHVIGLRVGQTLVIKNSDPIAHNTKIDGLNTQVNPLVPSGQSVEVPIDAPENVPAPVSCSIHGWMHAYMVVRPNPYFAISDKNGDFEIKNLPAGDLEFQVWQEKSGYVTDAIIGGQATKWTKGRVKWTIEADKTTDLGTMKLAADQFNK
ncbi:MAG TPA: hypothetical protein VHX65_19625 [Pirellulales bacterium]|jgi:hypothetical protein|nr:hypothetical protein [Pirellulales bacterium]